MMLGSIDDAFGMSKDFEVLAACDRDKLMPQLSASLIPAAVGQETAATTGAPSRAVF
jgi:hypothetical protein